MRAPRGCPHELERDDKGYICTGRDLTTWKLERAPFPLETSLRGSFLRRRRAPQLDQARIQRSRRGKHGDRFYSPISGAQKASAGLRFVAQGRSEPHENTTGATRSHPRASAVWTPRIACDGGKHSKHIVIGPCTLGEHGAPVLFFSGTRCKGRGFKPAELTVPQECRSA